MKYRKKELVEKLKIIGLTEKESEIYLNALELGACTVLALSKVSSIKRSTIYNVIENLEKKGLLTVQINGFKKLYEALPPKNLQQHLERQKRELMSCLPELENLYTQHKDESLIRVYRGKEAKYTAYNWVLDTLKFSDDYLVFGDLESWYKSDPEFFEAWPLKRREMMKQGKSIFFESEISKKYLEEEKNYQTNVKILKKSKKIKAIKIISNNFIFIHKIENPEIIFVIENKNISAMYKEMFELIWEMLD